jgi:hypothetical protein
LSQRVRRLGDFEFFQRSDSRIYWTQNA